jgi:hypothetical protein
VEALDICPAAEGFGNLLPVLSSIDSDRLSEFFVLSLSPVSLNFHVGSIMVLSCLVLGWPSLVQVWIQHLMANQFLLSLTVSQIIQIVGHF